MKNKQQGFIVPLLVIIIVLLVGVGGFYIHSQNKLSNDMQEDTTGTQNETLKETNVKTSVGSTVSTDVVIHQDLTDQKIAEALGKGITSNNQMEGVYRGDLNGDGYSDAVTWIGACSATNDCGYGMRIVINKKDGTAESINNLIIPDTISGWSGGKSTTLDAVKIDQGIMYITSSTFYSSGDVKTATILPKQTKKFRLQGNSLVEVK